MKSIFPNLVRAIVRYVSEVATSEAGELLSVRRKWHLLEAERYARLAAGAAGHSEANRSSPGRRCAIRRTRATSHSGTGHWAARTTVTLHGASATTRAETLPR